MCHASRKKSSIHHHERCTNIDDAVIAPGVAALATNSAGDLYVGNMFGEVEVWSPKGGPVVLVQLGFAAEGIAVDRARGRVYLSNYLENSVLVYITKGMLLHMI